MDWSPRVTTFNVMTRGWRLLHLGGGTVRSREARGRQMNELLLLPAMTAPGLACLYSPSRCANNYGYLCLFYLNKLIIKLV